MSGVEWIILTQGGRPGELRAAINSVTDGVTVVVNSGDHVEVDAATVMSPGENLGIPAGRDWGVQHTDAPIVGFLDDDAVASPNLSRRVVEAFGRDPQLGAVALRLVDEQGATTRRHVPRFGGRDPDRGGEVTLFLGGACAVRRDAYIDAGGYWGDLFYGHEEVELAWRLIDRGWSIAYLPEARVFHPRTGISRHVEGWFMTGRNRVMIARRTLPWPVASVHMVAWLVIGMIRAPDASNRRAYVRGWRKGWTMEVDRAPIRWRTVWHLTRLGRPPVL